MLILVTGGSGSGKSAYGEGRVLSLGEGRRIYIATMNPYDIESKKRVERHRRLRAGKGFETVERYTGLQDLILPSGAVGLLECLSNLTANEMFSPEGAGEETVEAVLSGVESLKRQLSHLVIVTNEIFSDGEVYTEDTLRYQKYLGELNRRLAAAADEVTEVVCGIPIHRKGGGDGL
ncbi:MAG: bifunctional adenosylcobinamide kinase/adenosylcobinamide-phosphate guanylyltransferase [Eubacteriales bacterium]|nr:bifunctional adenosylcobinamide kinase/adenosylcobinamide-phosphate guanylyltransferase [Eubacteriales bacterium]